MLQYLGLTISWLGTKFLKGWVSQNVELLLIILSETDD